MVEVILLWSFAAACLWVGPTPAGWAAVGLATWFSLVAANFYPQRIFVDLERPERLREGLAEDAPVLAAEAAGEIVAYPLELIVPHHIINDVIGARPILAAW